MTLTVQSLRSNVSGVEPSGLLPGQVAFNLYDKVIFIGDGSNTGRNADGGETPTKPGNGWFSTSIDFDRFLPNPDRYSPAPTPGQVLSFDGVIGKPVWSSTTDLTIDANNVTFDPSNTNLPAFDTNVQLALNDTAVLAWNANALAAGALQTAGGTMTGAIDFAQGQPVDAGTF